MGGGSADAAAVLRAANRIAGNPLDADALRGLAATLGSDVPSQIEPRHALVTGTGEIVEPIELPSFGAVLVPQDEGLAAGAVYDRFDALGGGRDDLDPALVHELAEDMLLGPVLVNDLQPAALALRPELADVLDELRSVGATGALVSGSGPTCFGLFPDREAAAAAVEAAATAAAAGAPGSVPALPQAIVAELRSD